MLPSDIVLAQLEGSPGPVRVDTGERDGSRRALLRVGGAPQPSELGLQRSLLLLQGLHLAEGRCTGQVARRPLTELLHDGGDEHVPARRVGGRLHGPPHPSAHRGQLHLDRLETCGDVPGAKARTGRPLVDDRWSGLDRVGRGYSPVGHVGGPVRPVPVAVLVTPGRVGVPVGPSHADASLFHHAGTPSVRGQRTLRRPWPRLARQPHPPRPHHVEQGSADVISVQHRPGTRPIANRGSPNQPPSRAEAWPAGHAVRQPQSQARLWRTELATGRGSRQTTGPNGPSPAMEGRTCLVRSARPCWWRWRSGRSGRVRRRGGRVTSGASRPIKTAMSQAGAAASGLSVPDTQGPSVAQLESTSATGRVVGTPRNEVHRNEQNRHEQAQHRPGLRVHDREPEDHHDDRSAAFRPRPGVLEHPVAATSHHRHHDQDAESRRVHGPSFAWALPAFPVDSVVKGARVHLASFRRQSTYRIASMSVRQGCLDIMRASMHH